MDLYNFYLTSQSIYAVVATLFIIILGVAVIYLLVKVDRLSKQVDEIAKNGIETSNTIREFVDETISKINNFSREYLSFEAARKLSQTIIDAINKNRKD